jgi:hypothetical protein
VRILTTNDFVGSFFPQATSYGRLPGAAALQATVDGLRTEAGGGIWIDTGDLAQESALSGNPRWAGRSATGSCAPTIGSTAYTSARPTSGTSRRATGWERSSARATSRSRRCCA